MFRRILIGAAAVFALCLVFLFGVNRFSLTLELAGEPETVLECGESYIEPGADVLLKGTLFWKEGIAPDSARLRITGTVDGKTKGKYSLRYTGEYLWFRAEATRLVQVVDTQGPIITLLPDPEEALKSGVVYEEAGYHAYDNYDGDITDRVIRRESMGRITYAVTDSSGNPAYAERIIPFLDPVPPEILLEGAVQYDIPVGRPYQEPGYSARDNVDGDLTDLVAVEGEVDWLRSGIYPISYTVTDAYENTAEVIRQVRVTAAERPETDWPQSRTVYLTFDDGPGPHTERLLDVLDKYGVKATFFVVDSEYNHLMQEIVNRGHSIGIHSVTHDYAQVYASPEAFFEDLYTMQQIIFDNTGVQTTLMRFPGGSSNEVSRNTCEGIMTFLTDAVQDAGFRFFDWNVDSDDAGKARKRKTVLKNVTEAVAQTEIALVLQHDIHSYSVDAVEEIILWGLDNGYTFLPLTQSSPNFPHPLNN